MRKEVRSFSYSLDVHIPKIPHLNELSKQPYEETKQSSVASLPKVGSSNGRTGNHLRDSNTHKNMINPSPVVINSKYKNSEMIFESNAKADSIIRE